MSSVCTDSPPSFPNVHEQKLMDSQKAAFYVSTVSDLQCSQSRSAAKKRPTEKLLPISGPTYK